ncbi:MAG: cytochrome c oxidase accessory protein CcoG [Asticcacaulis sp.]
MNTTETQVSTQLFEKAEKIYPRRVKGNFRSLKWIAMIVLLGIYYGAPWLRWDRGPHVPDQAILIDLVGQRGYFFGIEIWPQEVYLLVGVLILAAVGLFFATALLGRVWCGYACPQTVWTDLFVWVERFVQGDRNARRKLDQSKWTFNKIWKKGLTHFIWIVIGMLTGGAWVFYFNDAPTLFDHILHFDVSWTVLGWVIALTLSTWFMAGFARENICTYACPYSRFQSAMFDKDTLIVTYEAERGEPRGKHKAGTSWEGRGHCIDCTACVVVCPMGIDIREGLQIECISCGLCVDACNEVMDKVGLPRGLIRYDTENNLRARQQSGQTYSLNVAHRSKGDPKVMPARLPVQKEKIRWLRPRTLAYVLILSIVGGLMIGAIATRQVTEVNVIHNRAPQFVRLSDGSIRNNYQIKVLNKSHDDRHYQVTVSGLGAAEVTVLAAGDRPVATLDVPANSVGEFRLMVVTGPAASDADKRQEIDIVLKDTQSGKETFGDSYFAR